MRRQSLRLPSSHSVVHRSSCTISDRSHPLPFYPVSRVSTTPVPLSRHRFASSPFSAAGVGGPNALPGSIVERRMSGQGAAYNDLFLVPGGSSSSHMVAISTPGNQVSVIAVTGEEGPAACRKVRTLTGITSPQKVCMVTRYKALILCGDRQLKLYDLDRGCLLLKLKGVMNQKMPYFACIDEKNCIALSRNRMTVNIMSLETGDLTTTFKVGEDRFLNSLLVSGNGNICVCGDETQKPFPLLVWDLNARKLLYDLRLQHHNFLTQFSAISHDAHFVVSIAEEINSPAANFIVVYDLMSGMLFKKWKPGINTTAICIIGKLVVNACIDHSIMIWDLSTGDRKHVLTGHTAAVDRLRTSATDAPDPLLLSHDSAGADPVLRVWNMDSGQLVRQFTPPKAITCCQITGDGQRIVYSIKGSLEVHSLRISATSPSSSSSVETETYGDQANEGKTFQLEN